MEKKKLTNLPIAPALRCKLHKAGYRSVGDFHAVSRQTLCEDCGISEEEAQCVLGIIDSIRNVVIKPRTGIQVLQEEESSLAVMTFCEELDIALDGGVKCGQLTEICGLPGTGKTHLCLQLACDVQIPAVFGGLEAQALYVDTCSGCVIDRLHDIVVATVQHCHFMARDQSDKDILTHVAEMTVEKLLAGIHVQSCMSSTSLLAVIHTLPELLVTHPQVKLVVIDSISSYFRHEFEDMLQRTRVLTSLAQTLKKYAGQFNIAAEGIRGVAAQTSTSLCDSEDITGRPSKRQKLAHV